MFIDNNSVPFQRYCIDEVIETIPRDYPPKFYQYVDGARHFIIRRRDNGYPVAVFDSKRVRDELCRDPVGWENECIDANLAIDRWMANERGENGNFWLFYLPLLNRWEYGHERVDYGSHATYELRDREVRLWFECDIRECAPTNGPQMRRHVAEFLYHAQRPEGWESDYWTNWRRGTHRPTPPNRRNIRPEFPMDTNAAIQPGYGSDASSASTRVEDANESHATVRTMELVVDNSDTSSDGFGRIISDIEDNLGTCVITGPGTHGPIQYTDRIRDDDEYEWGIEPNTAGRLQYWIGDFDDDNANRNDQRESYNHSIERSDDEFQSDIINTQGKDVVGTIQYAVHAGYPWFFYGTLEENKRYEYLWRSGALHIPDVKPPEPDDVSDDEYEYDDYDRYTDRPDTPYEESPYPQDRS
ncbi:7087_t:CDS:2 [Paraglomus occultum]|uniref:7087_t:CDS:1 n=1 Tax=Paraglomus occultum TaxID=144539 RepID=A0A9N9DGH8_9GLOM|nr:7087_t:CDS:2 [Paraglomus occultum]